MLLKMGGGESHRPISFWANFLKEMNKRS